MSLATARRSVSRPICETCRLALRFQNYSLQVRLHTQEMGGSWFLALGHLRLHRLNHRDDRPSQVSPQDSNLHYPSVILHLLTFLGPTRRRRLPLARSNSLLATPHCRGTLSQRTPCNMTLYPNHPDVEKREMLRIDGIIEPDHKSLYCSVSVSIFKLMRMGMRASCDFFSSWRNFSHEKKF